jgi:hypothetical protein
MPRLFDSYLVVDWSANNEPKAGQDSIWWCEVGSDGRVERLHNERTRGLAYDAILGALLDDAKVNRRTLVGFDFPYGYPNGWSEILGLSGTPWLATWKELSKLVTDDGLNRNNRFQVAAELNKRASSGPFPFWGCPASQKCAFLQPRSSWREPLKVLPEFRETEKQVGAPHSPWKMFTAGSVGSQALVGIPYLNTLVQHPHLRPFTKVWPFETGGSTPQTALGQAAIVHAEIYPSLLKVFPQQGEAKDEAQVKALASHFFELDSKGRLAALFDVPSRLDRRSRRHVEEEEGWILGVSLK